MHKNTKKPLETIRFQGAFCWRRGRDSNPRALSRKLISSQPRYDHFDTSPYAQKMGLAAHIRRHAILQCAQVIISDNAARVNSSCDNFPAQAAFFSVCSVPPSASALCHSLGGGLFARAGLAQHTGPRASPFGVSQSLLNPGFSTVPPYCGKDRKKKAGAKAPCTFAPARLPTPHCCANGAVFRTFRFFTL